MVTEHDQEKAPDKIAEPANDMGTESSLLNAGELASEFKNRVDALNADQKQRVLDYIEDKARDTGSYQFLKDLRLSLVDDKGISLTRKPALPIEPGGIISALQPEAKSSSGEKAEKPTAARDDAGKDEPSALGGDWIDNLIDEAIAFIESESGKSGAPPSPLKRGETSGDGQKKADEVKTPGDRQLPQPEPAAPGRAEATFAAPRVEKEGDKVTQVTYPDGTKVDIEYHGKEPNKITQSPSGDKFERQQDGSWKQFSKDESGSYKELTPEPGKDIKKVNVTPEGDIIATQGNGSTNRQNRDGSQVETQRIGEKDCVTLVKRPNGSTTETEYDAEGNAKKVKSSEFPNESWEKKDGVWKHMDDQGNEIPAKEGEQPVVNLMVSPEGNVTAFNGDGGTVTQNTDGSVVETKLIAGEDGVQSDHVTRVTHPNGEQQEIEYDEKGRPIKWSSTDPSETMVKQPDGTWLCTREDGTTKTFDSDITVHDNGDISHRYRDGSFEEIYNHDGTVTEIHKGEDGKNYELNSDPDGNWTEIKHPNGKSTHIDYDKNDPPGPVKISRPDGSEWKKEGGGWCQYKDGKPTGEMSRGDITVREDGVIVLKNAAGEEVEKWRPNGKTTDLDRPETTIDDETGKITEETYPGKHGEKDTTYKYKDGKLTEAQAADGKTWKKTDDGKWQQYDGDKPVAKPQDIDLKVARNGDCIATKGGEPSFIMHRDGSRTDFLGDGSRVTSDSTGRAIEKVRADGSYTKFSPDNTSVTKNKDNQVTEVTDKTGKVIRKIDYDDKGNPTKIVENGKVLERKADGTWTGPDAEGYYISVTPEGGIERSGGGRKWTRNLDDSITRVHPDRTTTTERERDGRPEVTQVTYENGAKRDIQYDENGKAIRVEQTSPDGKKTVLLGKDKKGDLVVRRPGTDEWLAAEKVGVDNKGNVTVDAKNDTSVELGESQVEKTTIDGEQVVSRVATADGKWRAYSYNDKGELNEVWKSDGSTYKRESDGTWSRKDSEGHKSKIQDVQVDKNGNLSWKDGMVARVERADGISYMVDGENGTTVECDKYGRPVYIDGKVTRSIEYGEDNKPKSIGDVDGETKWVNEGGDKWRRCDPYGSPVEPEQTYNGKAEVKQDGTVVWTGKTGQIYKEYADGSVSVEANSEWTLKDADGHQVEKSKLDEHGRVTDIENARGKRHIEYDPGPDGTANLIIEPDGTRWVRDGDIWNQQDRNRVDTGTKAKIYVNEDGDVKRLEGTTVGDKFVPSGDKGVVTEYSDGTREVWRRGSSTHYNTMDQISKVTYPDGRERVFTYDENGDLAEVRKSGGTRYFKENGKWTRYSEGGKSEEVKNVNLDKDGNLTWERGDIHWRENADGTSERKDTTKETTIKSDSSTRPVEISNKNVTRKIEYGDDGQPKRITEVDGKSTWVNEGGDKWRRYDENDKPVEPEDTYEGTAEIKHGDIIWRKTGTDRVTTEHADGSKTISESGETTEYEAAS